jgi:hypothetical protein
LNDAFTDEVAVREQEPHSDKPRRSQSITFRLDSNTLDELQHEADLNQTSLNVLVNQALKRYSDWDRYENRIGMMPVPKAILSSLIDKVVDVAKKSGIKDEDIGHWRDQIIKQIAFNIIKDAVLFMKKQYNLWVVLTVLQDYMKVSGINSVYCKRNTHIDKQPRQIIILGQLLLSNLLKSTTRLSRIYPNVCTAL